MSATARRELVRHMVGCGLSERRSLCIIGMSASAHAYRERQQDRTYVFDCTEGFHNPTRRHPTLGYGSPVPSVKV